MTSNELATVAEVRRIFADGTFREMRRSLGISLGEFAASARIGGGTLSRYERGIRRPAPAEAIRCAHTLLTVLGAAN